MTDNKHVIMEFNFLNTNFGKVTYNSSFGNFNLTPQSSDVLEPDSQTGLEDDFIQETPISQKEDFDIEHYTDAEYEETHVLIMDNVYETYKELESVRDDEDCDNIESCVHDIDQYVVTENISDDSEIEFVKVEKNFAQDVFEISSDSDTENEIEINGIYRTTTKQNTPSTCKRANLSVNDPKLKIHNVVPPLNEPTESITCENAPKISAFSKQSADLTANGINSITSINLENDFCDICNTLFQNCKSLSSHKSTHLANRSTQCDVCENRFANRAGLYRHKLSHLPATMKCSYCPKSFKTVYWLNMHEKRHIMDESFQRGTSKVSCKDSLETSTLPLKMTNSIQIKPYRCTLCSEAYVGRNCLIIHLTIHTKQETFQCETCGKCFSSSRQIKWHVQEHNQNGKFKCEMCMKAMFVQVDYRHYNLVHNKGAVIRCPDCRLGSDSLNYFEEHKLDSSSVGMKSTIPQTMEKVSSCLNV